MTGEEIYNAIHVERRDFLKKFGDSPNTVTIPLDFREPLMRYLQANSMTFLDPKYQGEEMMGMKVQYTHANNKVACSRVSKATA